MASHLEPRLSDTDLIEMLRYNFPIQVQRAMLGTQLYFIGEAIDLLKHMELMEEQDPFHRPTHNALAQDANHNNRLGPPRNNQGRDKFQGHVRNVQRYNPPN
jgi:hypothetical protein